MPPSVHKLTPFEKRLQLNRRLRAFGHNPLAPNCFWACKKSFADAVGADFEVENCEPCMKMRGKLGLVVRGDS